jgi:ATP-binding protein involved in chromosome partitioning
MNRPQSARFLGIQCRALGGIDTVKYVTKMAATLQNQLKNALTELRLPWSGESLAEAGAELAEDEGQLPVVRMSLGYPVQASESRIAAVLQGEWQKLGGTGQVELKVDSTVRRHAVQGTLAPLDGVKNVIAVSSAKGGVGKSTVAVNLALALKHEGARVGIIDADIYGPSQPIMLGVEGEQPVSHDGKTFEPVEAKGLQMISIGCIVDTTQPMVWRGPMVTQALNQLLFQTNWDDLDYLIVDMPPGTGDIQLTLAQKVPVSGAVIVTTPQDIALADAVRGMKMFEKVNIPVLGLVENMSTFECPSCGEATPLFGTGGGVATAEQYGIKLLGKLPLDLRIREQADCGEPTVVAAPDSTLGLNFRDIALHAVALLARRPRDYKAVFGGIKVEKA